MKLIIATLMLAIGAFAQNTTYKDGTDCNCDSIFIAYYAKGGVYEEIPYKNGHINGMVKSYASDGTLDTITNYCDDSICPNLTIPAFNYTLDTNNCKLIFDDGSHSFSVCKRLDVDSFYKIDPFKLVTGIYYIIESDKITNAYVIGQTSVLHSIASSDEFGYDIYTVYTKKKGKWVITNSQTPSDIYETDSTYDGIEHRQYRRSDDSLYTLHAKWYTKNYYGAKETPSIVYGNGTEYYSQSYDNEYKYAHNDDQCNVSCYGNSCHSTQTFPVTKWNDSYEQVDTLSIDTYVTQFDLKSGKYVKRMQYDTTTYVIDTAYIDGDGYYETSLTMVLVNDVNTTYNVCSSDNQYSTHGKKPISMYGIIDGVEVEGKCASNKSSNSYTCSYKDITGKKFGSIIGYGIVSSKNFLDKDGKTSEGMYRKGTKIGL